MKAGNALVKAVTTGWQTSGIVTMRTGFPFTPGYSVSGAGNVNITGSYTEGAENRCDCRLQSVHRLAGSFQPPERSPASSLRLSEAPGWIPASTG